MSSRIIEAKFQALDRTIRLLNKTSLRAKVSSSDQLRELVYAQQRPQSAVKSSDETAALRKSRRTEGRPHTARHDSTGQPNDAQVGAFRRDQQMQTEPASKLDRTEVLLRESWNEIESAVPRRQVSTTARSTAAMAHTGDPNQDEQTATREPSPVCSPPWSPHSNQRDDPKDALAGQRPISSAGLSRKFIFDEQRQSQRGSGVAIATNPKSTGRNWFESQPRPRPPLPQKKTRKVSPHINTRDSNTDGEPSITTEKMPSESSQLIDSPSFYYLEVRLDHPTPLVDWRFRATFTDLSVLPRPSVTVDNVPVDARNCLLFTTANGAPGTSTIIRYFDPVFHFPHVAKPRDLYGHCIRILVHSTMPVQRVVIDTLVHFLLDELTPHNEVPTPVLTPAPNSPVKTEVLTARRAEKLELVLPRAKALPMDTECGGWEVRDDDSDHDQGSLWTKRSMASPRSEDNTAANTTDKKRIELKQLRSNMRKKLSDESQQLRRDQQMRPSRR